MFDELFYKRLSELRIAKGVSSREMSLSIGQSEGYINNIENKNNLPSMTGFFYICEYLGVTPSEFFDDGNKAPGLLGELINDMKGLKSEHLQNLSGIVKGLKR